MPASGRPPVTWLTCLDGRDHAVEGGVGEGGLYETACGRRVLPECSQAPPSPRCATCLRSVAAWQRGLSGHPRAEHPRARRFRGLFRGRGH